MTNPVLVEVLRGDIVESRHAGSIAVFDADGAAVMTYGDIDRPVFPRSAVKTMQALPLVENGAADAYGFGDRELAFTCASHTGEQAHADLARDILGRCGLDVEALECGAHWPMGHDATVELARSGAMPTALHNNCSGKHSGFLCACRHIGLDHSGYVNIGHGYQRMIAEAMTDVTRAPHHAENSGTDGCSIPTYAIPLRNVATGFARMATGTGLAPVRASAARRLLAACMAQPFYTSGTGQASANFMRTGKGRVFTKDGAEGVFCAAVPELGVGIAIKADDGAGRGREVMLAAVLAKLLAADPELSAAYAALATPVLKNWNGIEVGSLRPVAALA